MRTGTRQRSTQNGARACSGTSECRKDIYLWEAATPNTRTPFLMHAQGNQLKMTSRRSSMTSSGQRTWRMHSSGYAPSHCKKNRMVFSPEKFKCASKSVKFAGSQITMKGIQPTDKYITAIKNFPTPTNISTVRSWFGRINQVAYSFMKTDHMAPFRHLLSQLTTFGWNDELETAFKRSKEKIWS